MNDQEQEWLVKRVCGGRYTQKNAPAQAFTAEWIESDGQLSTSAELIPVDWYPENGFDDNVHAEEFEKIVKEVLRPKVPQMAQQATHLVFISGTKALIGFATDKLFRTFTNFLLVDTAQPNRRREIEIEQKYKKMNAQELHALEMTLWQRVVQEDDDDRSKNENEQLPEVPMDTTAPMISLTFTNSHSMPSAQPFSLVGCQSPSNPPRLTINTSSAASSQVDSTSSSAVVQVKTEDSDGNVKSLPLPTDTVASPEPNATAITDQAQPPSSPEDQPPNESIFAWSLVKYALQLVPQRKQEALKKCKHHDVCSQMAEHWPGVEFCSIVNDTFPLTEANKVLEMIDAYFTSLGIDHDLEHCTYCLLRPRADDLPDEHESLHHLFKELLTSMFYHGQGSSQRPKQHFEWARVIAQLDVTAAKGACSSSFEICKDWAEDRKPRVLKLSRNESSAMAKYRERCVLAILRIIRNCPLVNKRFGDKLPPEAAKYHKKLDKPQLQRLICNLTLSTLLHDSRKVSEYGPNDLNINSKWIKEFVAKHSTEDILVNQRNPCKDDQIPLTITELCFLAIDGSPTGLNAAEVESFLVKNFQSMDRITTKQRLYFILKDWFSSTLSPTKTSQYRYTVKEVHRKSLEESIKSKQAWIDEHHPQGFHSPDVDTSVGVFEAISKVLSDSEEQKLTANEIADQLSLTYPYYSKMNRDVLARSLSSSLRDRFEAAGKKGRENLWQIRATPTEEKAEVSTGTCELQMKDMAYLAFKFLEKEHLTAAAVSSFAQRNFGTHFTKTQLSSYELSKPLRREPFATAEVVTESGKKMYKIKDKISTDASMMKLEHIWKKFLPPGQDELLPPDDKFNEQPSSRPLKSLRQLVHEALESLPGKTGTISGIVIKIKEQHQYYRELTGEKLNSWEVYIRNAMTTRSFLKDSFTRVGSGYKITEAAQNKRPKKMTSESEPAGTTAQPNEPLEDSESHRRKRFKVKL